MIVYERMGREGTFSETQVNVCFDPLLEDSLPKHFPTYYPVSSPTDLEHGKQFDRHVRGCFIPGCLYWVMMYSVCFFHLTAVKINLNRDKETICHHYH